MCVCVLWKCQRREQEERDRVQLRVTVCLWAAFIERSQRQQVCASECVWTSFVAFWDVKDEAGVSSGR